MWFFQLDYPVLQLEGPLKSSSQSLYFCRKVNWGARRPGNFPRTNSQSVVETLPGISRESLETGSLFSSVCRASEQAPSLSLIAVLEHIIHCFLILKCPPFTCYSQLHAQAEPQVMGSFECPLVTMIFLHITRMSSPRPKGILSKVIQKLGFVVDLFLPNCNCSFGLWFFSDITLQLPLHL